MEWAETQAIALSHIQPGKPQQNAYVERYNRTVRHEWLDQYIIESIEEAQEFATQWLWTYNNERPNMGIGGITPAQKLGGRRGRGPRLQRASADMIDRFALHDKDERLAASASLH